MNINENGLKQIHAFLVDSGGVVKEILDEAQFEETHYQNGDYHYQDDDSDLRGSDFDASHC